MYLTFDEYTDMGGNLDETAFEDFEFEAGVKIFYNIPCLYDRVDNSNTLLPFLEKLGLFKKS